jgi:metallo-beta-lactamase family protein
MAMELGFYGAAQNVTGSSYLLETREGRILIDCGLYQERQYRKRNWDNFPVPPRSIDAVLLTHAHLDHCGRLPKLVREGFAGRIYCTSATADIAGIVLEDSARIQEEDAEFKRKRHEKEGRKAPHPEIPLYTGEDVEKTLPLFQLLPYEKTTSILKGVEATFVNAGHILGSSMVRLEVDTSEGRRTLVFSGDVGRWDKPIIEDPTLFEQADYIQMESTYGDRLHRDEGDIGERLSEIINSTCEKGGNIVVPSFALERTQELLYHLNLLLMEDRIPHLLVYVDSPMAIKVTDVFERHLELFDREMAELIKSHSSPFNFFGLNMSRTSDESKAINYIKGTVIIIAGSGMCTGGRIKHHLVRNVDRRESTILFVGYQAVGTLGRHLLERPEEVRIFGQRHKVRARIDQIHGFSAHADREELLRWLNGFTRAPKRLFLTHGEKDAIQSLAGFIRKEKGWKITVPGYGDRVPLA